MFPFAGLVMGFGPAQLQDVGEEALGEAVPANHGRGHGVSVVGEADLAARIDGDGPRPLHSPDQLADRRARDLQPLGDARLDHVDVVFGDSAFDVADPRDSSAAGRPTSPSPTR